VIGSIVSAAGIYLSLTWDLPTGATIVCTFGFVLIVNGYYPRAHAAAIAGTGSGPPHGVSGGTRVPRNL
jgi:hypothetical protein